MNESISNRKQLEEYFLKFPHCAPACKVGVELEKLGVDRLSGRAIPYHGTGGIAGLLERLTEQSGWQASRENGNIMQLSLEQRYVTLEPGGQLELSSSECDFVYQIEEQIDPYLHELKRVSSPAGIAWLGLGLHPVSKLEEIEWIPKNRYRIMAPHMQRNGTRSHDMMKKTASIHVTLDYHDEQDFSEKMHLALRLVPITTAMFANSPIAEGKLTGLLSTRARIWQHTDPARCGMISEAFFDHPSFSAYVDYALDVPMLFIVRSNRWIAVNNITFRQFMKEGYQDYHAAMGDWELHLSSIFTDIRVRQYIEIRNCDCQRRELTLAPAAFWKAVLYDPEARLAAQSLMRGISWSDILSLRVLAAEQGLRTRFKGTTIGCLAKELVNIAMSSLKKSDNASGTGQTETRYLEALRQLVEEDNLSPADIITRNWLGSWGKDLMQLIRYTAY